MKIVIAHNAYPQYGGEDTVVANETAMLEKHGCEVVPWIVPTEETGVLNLIRCGLSAVWNPFAGQRLKRLLQREKPDIVHCHNTFPLLSPSIFAACHSVGIPVIQTIHNYRHICPAGGFFRDGEICEECIGKRFPAPVLKHRCYRSSLVASAIPALTAYAQRVRSTFERDVDALIALNEFGKQKLVEGGLPANRITIKPNFCPDIVLNDPRPAGQPFTLCFAGRLSIDKGIGVLLDAWTGFSNALDADSKTQPRLRIIGDGDLADRVAKTAEQCNAIEYLGSLSHKDTVREIAHADGLVCPSIWYEGMPMTLLEAFSAGTPVIASRIGGLPEMVQEGHNGLLFDPGDTEQLAAHFHQLYSSPALMTAMGSSARNTHASRYSEAVNFPLLEAIYRNVIERFDRLR
jgi:glycosyltransferase involved in cell wall biosynthesis